MDNAREPTQSMLFGKVYGCLAGGAIGDAMGGATEMMHYRTIERVFGEITDLVDNGDTRDTARFSPGQEAGKFTDDTRLRHIVCQAVIEAGGRITVNELASMWRQSLSGWYFVPVVNSYYKIMAGVRPRDVGRGNMASNSTAMSIAPVGVINACDPRQAAQDAYDVASLVHEGYARDAAALVAAAVAAAYTPGTTVDAVVEAALGSIDPDSEMIRYVRHALELSASCGDYAKFRGAFYDTMLVDWPQTNIVDGTLAPPGFYDTAEPRETIPAALALFVLADGDPFRAILHAANFGRDADTLGAIVGSLAGAFGGIDAIPGQWVRRVEEVNDVDLGNLSRGVLEALLNSIAGKERVAASVRSLLVSSHPPA